MKRIVLILTPARFSSSCVESALRAASAERAELVIVFVLDTTISEDVQSRLTDMGFLGEVPSSELLRAMRDEQVRQGKKELSRIADIAAERGIRFRTEFMEGEFVTASLEVATKEAADAIFVARRERPRLSRLVTGSAVSDLKDAAPCEVHVHDERRST